MNKKHLKAFVKALNNLPVCIKDLDVDMTSYQDPWHGSIGNHLGLISLLLPYCPPLQRIHAKIKKSGQHGHLTCCQMALADYLEVGSVGTWAEYNPVVWGNEHGLRMFETRTAFKLSQGNPDILDHWFIIAWWTEVYNRLNCVEA